MQDLPSLLESPNYFANESTLIKILLSIRDIDFKDPCLKHLSSMHTWTPSGLIAMNLETLMSFTTVNGFIASAPTSAHLTLLQLALAPVEHDLIDGEGLVFWRLNACRLVDLLAVKYFRPPCSSLWAFLGGVILVGLRPVKAPEGPPC